MMEIRVDNAGIYNKKGFKISPVRVDSWTVDDTNIRGITICVYSKYFPKNTYLSLDVLKEELQIALKACV